MRTIACACAYPSSTDQISAPLHLLGDQRFAPKTAGKIGGAGRANSQRRARNLRKLYGRIAALNVSWFSGEWRGFIGLIVEVLRTLPPFQSHSTGAVSRPTPLSACQSGARSLRECGARFQDFYFPWVRSCVLTCSCTHLLLCGPIDKLVGFLHGDLPGAEGCPVLSKNRARNRRLPVWSGPGQTVRGMLVRAS